jgi:hypothetical protein
VKGKTLLYFGSSFATPCLLHLWTLLLEGVGRTGRERPLKSCAAADKEVDERNESAAEGDDLP